jgi:hypothetical protein
MEKLSVELSKVISLFGKVNSSNLTSCWMMSKKHLFTGVWLKFSFKMKNISFQLVPMASSNGGE